MKPFENDTLHKRCGIALRSLIAHEMEKDSSSLVINRERWKNHMVVVKRGNHRLVSFREVLAIVEVFILRMIHVNAGLNGL